MPPSEPESSRAEDETSPAHEPAAQRGRRRGGRPKKAEATGRTSRVHVLLTAAEKARVRREASAGGLSISEYARRRMLGRSVVPRVDADAERQLRRIGVNLNQLARVANTSGQVERGDELDLLVTELRRTIAGLRGGSTPLADP
ncbi:plasmid mobilization protein [Rubricoccus marinus]|uniref:Uncharacterized protein n=1 Tax=Rubricoccus marinus TaxID=716817 RepID=A0A259TTX7_9BACT|nr:plasmid mobilization relaxosome protein MobC [Rubricoccus marinus]OZC01126.1 hypothetical protein BSZ36_18560 [Rubricoccus marinus]